MSSGGQSIGSGSVDIKANFEAFDRAIDKLPERLRGKLGKFQTAIKSLQAEIARNKLEIKVAVNTQNIAGVQQLTQIQQQLYGKLNLVTQAGTRQANAIRAGASDAGMAAMKWMILAQTVDDMQYGFRAIVNNIPMMAGAFMGFGNKAAAAISIAAVAVNQFAMNWDKVRDIFRGNQTFAAIERGWDRITFAAYRAASAQLDATKAAAEEKHKKQAQEAEGIVAGMQGKEERERGKNVREVIEEGAGADALAGQLVMQRIKETKGSIVAKEEEPEPFFGGLAGTRRKAKQGALQDQKKLDKLRSDMEQLIAAASKGDEMALKEIERLSPEFARKFRDAQKKKVEDKQRKEEEEEDKFQEQDEAENLHRFRETRERNRRRAQEVAKDIERAPEFKTGEMTAGGVRNIIGGMGVTREGRLDSATQKVIDELRKDREESINRIMGEKGVDKKTAEQMLVNQGKIEQVQAQRKTLEDQIRANPDEQVQFKSMDQYLKDIQASASEQMNPEKEAVKKLTDIETKLEEQNKKLEEISKKGFPITLK